MKPARKAAKKASVRRKVPKVRKRPTGRAPVWADEPVVPLPIRVRREWLEELIFHGEGPRRFTQDSPVLPDVWLEFGDQLSVDRRKRTDLLLTPHRDASAPALCNALRQRFADERQTPQWQAENARADTGTELAYHQSSVVIKVTFAELIRVVLPMSQWWRDVIPGKTKDLADYLNSTHVRERVLAGLRKLSAEPQTAKVMQVAKPSAAVREKAAKSEPIPPDLLWMIRVVGTLLLASTTPGLDTDAEVGTLRAKKQFFDLSRDLEKVLGAFRALIKGMLPPASFDVLLFSVACNRRVTPTIARSVMAVKGDAARRLFNIDTRNIAWAILDSGIDAKHPAFRKRDPATRLPFGQPFVLPPGSRTWKNQTNVAATYDFGRIRQLLDPALSTEERKAHAPALPSARASGATTPRPQEPASHQLLDESALQARATDLTNRLQEGRAIDWEELAPLLVVPTDDTYKSPELDHGTHVAGILAANWIKSDWPNQFPPDQKDDLIGVCPGLTLYDFRVLDEDGRGDEFTVMAALQFIRHLNAHRDEPPIQGANLSLSLRHDVANYACGRTPVCDECERVVSSGVVVVAAAGNDGYLRFKTASGDSEGYRSISISDPGNADAVITVGATHRSAPHTYGVSYFSSRGPTGDGRIKPDLVAPGEKITAPVTNDRVGTKDGTSMAAPHVSGAAVLLMARHRELMGEPVRIKEILCSTATNLGRERYFQGAGMVDILRALQSV